VLCSSLLITAGLPLGVLSASDTARHSTAHCGSSAGAEACTECNLLQCRAPVLLTPAAASTVKCTGWCQRIEHNSSPNPSTSPYATTAAANRPVEHNGSLNPSTSPTRLCGGVHDNLAHTTASATCLPAGHGLADCQQRLLLHMRPLPVQTGWMEPAGHQPELLLLPLLVVSMAESCMCACNACTTACGRRQSRISKEGLSTRSCEATMY
jgi:hypothetical protein